MGIPRIDRTREDKEDGTKTVVCRIVLHSMLARLLEELSEKQRALLRKLRGFTDGAAQGWAGPRMENLYQKYRSAVRATGLALEENPKVEPSFEVLIAFYQRQADRCQEAILKAELVHHLCVKEAQDWRETPNGELIADEIMKYDKMLPGLQSIMEEARKGQLQHVYELQTDMERVARGENPIYI